MPPTPVTITADAAAANQLPACTVGLTYKFEPVPTDVELGPDGWLYVSSLPGGPEDPSLGANGRVYKVNPKSGKVKLLAGGFISTVDVAVANNGDVYVAEAVHRQDHEDQGGQHQGQALPPVDPAGRDRVDQGLPLRHRQRRSWAARSPKGKVIRIAW